MTALDLYNALTAMGVSVPMLSSPTSGTLVYENGICKRTGGWAYMNDTDAIYIMCGVMEGFLDNVPRSTGVITTRWFPSVKFPKKREYISRCHFDIDGHQGTAGAYAPTKHEALLACIKAVQRVN